MEDDLLVVPAYVNNPTYIKVVGVGGGGNNAVANMYRERIDGVKFLVCNSDKKALDISPVPDRLQIGNGLGAGGNPDKGRELAEESIEDIEKIFDDDTKMVFITAGMGGGTGTGASPVIARAARERGILTIGIVTIPFMFERIPQIDKALNGLQVLAEQVDALLVINNERLKNIYPDLSVINAFRKADQILTVAARSIVEIIHMRGLMGLDFEDVYNTLHNGGVAIISTGEASGERRMTKAIQQAITSPLLNNNDIFKATHFIMRITFNASEGESLQMEELDEIDYFMSNFQPNIRTKWGMDTDATLGDKLKVTILASGFGLYDKRKKKEDEEIRQQQEAVEENFDVERMLDFYPGMKNGNRPLKKKPNVYELSIEDLENEALIEALEEIPTYRRNKKELNEINNLRTDN